MVDLTAIPTRICLDFAVTIKREMQGLLYSHRQLESGLGRVTREKTEDHEQYGFDLFAHELLVRQLREKALNVKLFSEESGWISIGTGVDYVIVSDPFDQSSLTTRTFRGAAVAICVMDQLYSFAACAIGDLSTHLIYFADQASAYVLFPGRDIHLRSNALEHTRIQPSSVQSLSEALIISPGMRRKRRQFLCRSKITDKAFGFLNIDGVINLGRLAAGYIDAYLDPFIGQPIYEIVCAELAQRAGAVVTDITGTPFDLATLIHRLETDTEDKYRIVACCSEALHQEVLDSLADDRKAGLLSG